MKKSMRSNCNQMLEDRTAAIGVLTAVDKTANDPSKQTGPSLYKIANESKRLIKRGVKELEIVITCLEYLGLLQRQSICSVHCNATQRYVITPMGWAYMARNGAI